MLARGRPQHGQLVGPQHGAPSAATCSRRRPAATSRSPCWPSMRRVTLASADGRARPAAGRLLHRVHDQPAGRRRAARRDRRADPGRADRVPQVRPQARQHAGRRDRRGPPRVGRRPGRRRPDRARRRRPAPGPRPAKRNGCSSGPRLGQDAIAAAAASAAATSATRSPTPSPPTGTGAGWPASSSAARSSSSAPGAAGSEDAPTWPRRSSRFELGDREVEVMVRPMTTLQSVLRNQLG